MKTENRKLIITIAMILCVASLFGVALVYAGGSLPTKSVAISAEAEQYLNSKISKELPTTESVISAMVEKDAQVENYRILDRQFKLKASKCYADTTSLKACVVALDALR